MLYIKKVLFYTFNLVNLGPTRTGKITSVSGGVINFVATSSEFKSHYSTQTLLVVRYVSIVPTHSLRLRFSEFLGRDVHSLRSAHHDYGLFLETKN